MKGPLVGLWDLGCYNRLNKNPQEWWININTFIEIHHCIESCSKKFIPFCTWEASVWLEFIKICPVLIQTISYLNPPFQKFYLSSPSRAGCSPPEFRVEEGGAQKKKNGSLGSHLGFGPSYHFPVHFQLPAGSQPLGGWHWPFRYYRVWETDLRFWDHDQSLIWEFCLTFGPFRSTGSPASSRWECRFLDHQPALYLAVLIFPTEGGRGQVTGNWLPKQIPSWRQNANLPLRWQHQRSFLNLFLFSLRRWMPLAARRALSLESTILTILSSLAF